MIAGVAGCDPRPVQRALDEGPHVIKVRRLREAIVAAAAALNIGLPAPPTAGGDR